MGLLNRNRSRTRTPAAVVLDPLLALPAALPVLQTTGRLQATGVGSVCLKPIADADGVAAVLAPFLTATTDDGQPRYADTTDSFDHRWLTRRTTPGDIAGLTQDLYAVNAAVDAAGLGTALLCTLVGFVGGSGKPVGLVFRPHRGTWYPFVPTGPTARDSVAELGLRDAVTDSLTIESDLKRWSPLWGAPGL
jgi:hypothetical protein